MENLLILGVVIGVIILVVVGLVFAVAKFYRTVEQGRALIINKIKREPIVTFTGSIVVPIIHRAEMMDLSVKTIEIDRKGKEGLICKDNIRADIQVTFFVKVNKTAEDVLKVAQQVGCVRASDQKTLEALFQAKFSEALKTVGKQLDFEELYTKRESFKDEIIRSIGRDLNGYVLDDAAIDFLEQTPIESLDKDNILDAQGIRKITELTTQQNVFTNDLRQTERKAIKKQDVEATEAVLALERQEQDARIKQAREIATMKAREEAETQKVQAEEFKKAELARIKTEEEVKVNEEAKDRQIQVAVKNRERVIGVETERVEKDRMLEQITRERETELSRISKEKEIEIERKAIADVIRGRIAVDKTVAEEEERIKDTRVLAEARRNKDALVIAAEGQAQEQAVKATKTAEARTEVAKFAAKEKLTLADADLEAADRNAKAKIRISEGLQAEAAAEGLAAVRVKEANIIATEKEGFAKAKVIKEQMMATAQGAEAEAGAVEKRGMAEANTVRQKLLAEAAGAEEKGLAHARVGEADAAAKEKLGLAEAISIEKKLVAEAAGLSQKAVAMKALDGIGREHEEYRLRIERDKSIALAEIDTRVDIAKARAEILKQAFQSAKINIVGGDGQFFERFINAVSVGKAIDGAVDGSETAQKLLGPYLSGDKNLPETIAGALQGISSEDVKNLSVSGFLGQLMDSADAGTKTKLGTLLKRAKELGLDE